MGHTNAWDEDVPVGTEDAATADDYLRDHRLDLGERLEEMIYGFNASDNSGAENEVGIKHLKMYKQTSDPTAVTDYGHFYIKLVDGVPELFYQDDENTTLQLTSGGDLKSTANLVVDGTSTLTGNVACAGTLDVTGTTELIGVATIADTSVTKSTAAPTADAQIANKKYVDDQDTADHPAYSGAESYTDGSGRITKTGVVTSAAASGTVTFAAAFPTAAVAVILTGFDNAAETSQLVFTSSTTANFGWAKNAALNGFHWVVIGY